MPWVPISELSFPKRRWIASRAARMFLDLAHIALQDQNIVAKIILQCGNLFGNNLDNRELRPFTTDVPGYT